MTVNQLLLDVQELTKKDNALKKRSAESFNIFEIARVSTCEVTICRVLHNLLNPNGSHYQGTRYLKLFLNIIVPDEAFDEQSLEKAKVYREYTIQGNRRIDLYIDLPNKKIPIEVKIYAKDQDKQLEAYQKEALHANTYYLTPYGKMPTEKSLGQLDPSHIKTISFMSHINAWLTACLEDKQTKTPPPIREMLRQFQTAIHALTSTKEDSQSMAVQQLISSTSKNAKAAFTIENSLFTVKVNKLYDIFQAIEKGLNAHFAKLSSTNSLEHIEKYYSKNSSMLLNTRYEYKVNEDLIVQFTIEVDHRLYIGLNFVDSSGLKIDVDGHPFNSHNSIRNSNFFQHWEYLKCQHVDDIPNFNPNNFNDAYFQLFDSVEFDHYIKSCLAHIHNIINR